MAVRFVLGRAGTGKTHHCLHSIAAAMTDGESKLVLIVPEQASFQMERALAARCASRGYFRAEVLSFSRLAQRIFDDLGAPPEELSAGARRMALRALALRNPALLNPFGKAAATPGFFARLDELVEELQSENIDARVLRSAAEGMSDAAAARRVHALADVYASYIDWLGPQRIDPAARLAALRDRLARVAWLTDASLWIDGFAGFTGQELETLVALAARASRTTVTLLLDPQTLAQPDAGFDALRIFRKTERTYALLKHRLDEASVTVEAPLILSSAPPPRFHEAALVRLETAIAESTRPVTRPNDDGGAPLAVRVLECIAPRDEVRAVAREIRRRVVESGGTVAFGDFAVIARDVDRFAPLVAEVFAEYDIPFFLDQRRAIGAHPLCRLIRGLIDAAISDCSAEAMLRLIRSGLAPISREEAEDLEHAVLTSEVSGLDAWRLATWSFAEGVSNEFIAPARRCIVRAVEGLHALAHRSAPAEGTDWVRQLYAGVGECRAAQRLEAWIGDAEKASLREDAELHRACWGRFCELLDDFDAVLGPQEISATLFADVLKSGLNELSAGLAPPMLDQVLIGSIERSRHPDIKHAWLIGFNEGVFPRPPGDDGILSSAERAAVSAWGLESLAPRREDVLAERMLAYIAFTRPSHGLMITYSRIDTNGDPLTPSQLLDDVWAALPELSLDQSGGAAAPACAAELARELLRNDAGEATVSARLASVAAHLRADPRQRPILDYLMRGGEYSNAPQPVRLPPPSSPFAWIGSPSEVETYVQCPFRHFADRRLRIQTSRAPRPLEQELGSFAHEALAMVTRCAIAAKTPVQQIEDERWLTWLGEALDRLNSAVPADLSQRRPRAAYLMRRLGRLLQETLLAHAARWRIGSFEPLAVEAAFHPDRAASDAVLPPVELTLRDGRRIGILGRIDRIDRARDAAGVEHLLIYDYKSSAAGLHAPFLTGMRLASFAYFLAVEGGWSHPRRTAGLLIAPLYATTHVFEAGYVEVAHPAEQRLFAFRPRGLFDEQAAAALDPQVEASRQRLRAKSDIEPVPKTNGARDGDEKIRSKSAAIELKKDGDYTLNSDVCSAAELSERAELARRTIRKTVVRLAAGDIEVAPLLEKKTLACYTCDFRPVCRFDPAFNRPRKAERHLPQLGSPASGEECGDERNASGTAERPAT